MNKLYLSKNFAFLGSLAIGTIIAAGIATSPAQASILSTAGWGDGTDDWFDDHFVGVTNTVGAGPDTFDIDLTNGLFLLNPGGTGVFNTPEYALGEFLENSQFPITMTFEKLGTSGDGTVGDPFEYVLVDDGITFELPDTVDDETVTYTQPEGSVFDFVLDPGVEIEGFLNPVSDMAGFYEINDDPKQTIASTFEISDLVGVGAGGEYVLEAEFEENGKVPEPSTILGLLAFGGLGLGLKRKKQS